MNAVLTERPARLPLTQACRALGVPRSTVYARMGRAASGATHAGQPKKPAKQPRALGAAERAEVTSLLASPRYRDQTPTQMFHELLAQGIYLCSTSTMHRLLRQQKASGERRPQRPPRNHPVPRLLAAAPNQVWTWDITKLPAARRGTYLSLHVVLDLYSRCAVAWMVAETENAALAMHLMTEAAARHRVPPGTLTIHQDRGAPMIARSFLDLMRALDHTCSHGRPRVSNDNPVSEAAFKTLKYQPCYPGRFDSTDHARRWCNDYFDWYNRRHCHSSLAGFTPEQVFTGHFRQLAKVKQQALNAAYSKHPERFVNGPPRVSMPPDTVAINPHPPLGDHDRPPPVNFPTLAAAGWKGAGNKP